MQSTTSPVIWRPKEYQKDAVNFILEKQKCMLWLEPGLGKTSITLSAIKHLKQSGKTKKVLILAPLRVCRLVWPLEIEKWVAFNDLTYTILHGTKKYINLKKDVDMYIINYEGIAWLSKHSREMPKFDMIVFDELSKMKSYSTRRYSLIDRFFMDIPRRIGLTGSPAANSLMGLFSQTYVIDGGITFSRYITRFRNKYFYTEKHEYDFHLKEGAKDDMYERLAPFTMRLAAEDHVKMPTLIKNNLVITLSKESQRLYNELERNFITYLDSSEDSEHIRAKNAMTKMQKLCQVTSGTCYRNKNDQTGHDEPYHFLHNEKIDTLKELIDELQGQPIMVMYEYIHERERILRAFPGTPVLSSRLSKSKELEVQNEWNEGNIPILIGNPKSMGHGLNLQGSGNHICFITTTWDYELYDQTVRRIFRQGCKHPYVHVHHIVAKHTVDELILLNLRSKKATQNDLFDKIKEQAKLRNNR